MIITGDTLLNSASSLFYAGGDMSISEAKDITNQGADIKAQGNMSLTAPTITNENEAFSAKRVWTSEVTNPDLIRIDENGHPERGQSFTRDEFSALDSGYGAYHNKGITPKTLYEEAGYDKIEQITEEERKDGETPVPDDLVGKEAPNYDYNDPIFKELGVKSMDTPRPGYDDPKQADWDKQYKEILNQLNEKIKAYNEEAKAYNDSIGAIESKAIKYYTIIRTTTHTSEKQVQETKAGTISSGKDMTLTGNVTNEDSRITAGNTLTATGGTLNNVAEKNQVQKITFGTTQESYTKKKHWPHKAWRRHYRDPIFMTPQKELDNPTSLDVGTYEGHTGKNPTKEDITQTMRDNVQQNLNPFTDGKETNPGSTAGKETGGSLSFIPDSSLYKLHPEEKAKYLIETDPAFTNKKTFLSSDYMYNQLLWDNDKVNKRLGDGFYEQELIRNQVTQLTGMRYLNGYTNDEEEYMALMDAGIAYAKEYNLKPGIALTKEQMAALTSDMVWLEATSVTVNGKTYEVLYPHVYLKAGSEKKMAADGSLISANQLVMEAKNQLANSGVLMGNSILMQGKDIVNRGMIYGDTVQLKASHDIKESGIIHAENQVSLTADNNITMQDTVLHEKNQDVLHTTAGIAVKGKDGVLLMEAGKDIHLTGATLEALGDNGSLILKAGNNIHLDTDTLEAKKDMTENSDNYIRTYRKTETTNTLAAGKTITLAAGENLSARNTTVLSENGQITVAAKGDVNLENGYNESRDDYGLKYKERGLLSSKTTTIKSRDESKTVTASTLSGDAVQITAGGNTNMTGSQVIGTHDVAISSGKDTSISSAEEYERHDYAKQVKKSGLLSGGGLGFTIGTEKRKDQYAESGLMQKGSLIGSAKGNLSISSSGQTQVEGSTLVAGKDMTVIGENISISSKDNVYTSTESHEYKKSGLTVALGGALVNTAESIVTPLQKAAGAEDKRLSALYGVEAGKNMYGAVSKYLDNKKTIDAASKDLKDTQTLLDNVTKSGIATDFGKKNLNNLIEQDKNKIEPAKSENKASRAVSVDISLGTAKSASLSDSVTTQASPSQLKAGNTLALKSEKDISIKGSELSAEDILLKAGKDIHLLSAKESDTTITHNTSSSGSLGATIGAGGLQGLSASYGKGVQNSIAKDTTHKESTVSAGRTVSIKSGKDTDIIGSQVKAEQVTANVAGNLHIKSEQDSKEYHEEGKQIGASLGYNVASHQLSGFGSAGKSKTDSHYASVTEQAGIQAGKDGFDLTVGKETSLKGAVISSTAEKEKNHLTTGTLSWEDVENKANYKTGEKGIAYAPKTAGVALNARGLTPQIAPTVKDKAENSTKAGVSDGTITITRPDHQKQDIAMLNRNAEQDFQTLKEIFAKSKVEEKQELIAMLEKYGNQAIHQYAEKNGWKDGSSEKIALHTMLSGLTGYLSDSGVWNNGVAGGLNEYILGCIEKEKGTEWIRNHTDTIQAFSIIVGKLTQFASGHSNSNSNSNSNNDSFTSMMGSKWNLIGDGHPNQAIIGAGIGIDYSGHGHASIIFQFEDGTYEEGNFGRYGGDVSHSSYVTAPIGQGTYAFDYNYYLGKDNKYIFFLNGNANDIAYAYNDRIRQSGYVDETQEQGNVIINFDHNEKPILADEVRRIPNSTNDYNAFNNNCVTTSIFPLKVTLSWEDSILRQLYKSWLPLDAGILLQEDFYLHDGDGLVSWIWRPDGNE